MFAGTSHGVEPPPSVVVQVGTAASAAAPPILVLNLHSVLHSTYWEKCFFPTKDKNNIPQIQKEAFEISL